MALGGPPSGSYVLIRATLAATASDLSMSILV